MPTDSSPLRPLPPTRHQPACPRRTNVRLLGGIAALGLVLSSSVASADAGDGGGNMVERSGDLLQFGIPIIGLGLTFLLNPRRDDMHLDFSSLTAVPPVNLNGSSFSGSGFALDWPGPALNGSARHDFIVSFLRMEVATYALKFAINAPRPNGGSRSFPSGHTASAFMGAEFIRKEYGWGWGVPAFAAASWVGYSRVDSHNHYWRDVIGGALIGIASNHNFSGFETPIGHLSFEPTLMGSAPSQPEKLSADDFSRQMPDDLKLAPGLQIRLDFKP